MANHYVRAGATGTASGADWTDAYTTLPATLTRGDTYYIADGSYVGYLFDDAPSGTTLITIKKATISDHGTSTGWDDTFGDGQALFTSRLLFNSSYWFVDGQAGGGPGSWTTGFGFKINANTPTSGAGLRVNDNFTGITVRHFEVEGNGGEGNVAPSESNDGIATYPGTSNCTFSYGYIHDMGRTIAINLAKDSVFEYLYTGLFESTPAEHSELMVHYVVDNVTLRYNVFTFATPTGGIMASICPGTGCGGGGLTSGGLYIYGNVFYKAAGSPAWGGANGLIGTFTDFQLQNVKVYNNSFVNVVDMPVFGNLFAGVGTGNEVRNNIFYNVTDDGLPGGLWPTVTHNHWVDSGSTAGSDDTSGTGDPFTNQLGLNFHLLAGTTTGLVLSAPYTIDPDGTVRGADGTWDRGAYEFAMGGAPGFGVTAGWSPPGVRVVGRHRRWGGRE